MDLTSMVALWYTRVSVNQIEQEEEMTEYDYNSENYKTCPICDKTINYHVDGFYHEEHLNVWICRHHTICDVSDIFNVKLEHYPHEHLTLEDSVCHGCSKFMLDCNMDESNLQVHPIYVQDGDGLHYYDIATECPSKE